MTYEEKLKRALEILGDHHVLARNSTFKPSVRFFLDQKTEPKTAHEEAVHHPRPDHREDAR